MQTPKEMLQVLEEQKSSLEEDLVKLRADRALCSIKIKQILVDQRTCNRLINAVTGRKARVTKVLDPAPGVDLR